ncbi:MAG: prepilin-type N-terminal cleavage/methylation domain-containing protein [Desulfobacterales bacterium]|nr:prepilin-type N-terminal cleavage/methylation domain-containing protein [Desulfobacterales bacterium]
MEGERNKGFTLIEAVVAIGILAIGILAVASMQLTAFKGNRSARRQTEAVSLAAQRLEELAALPYEDARLAGGSHRESDVGPAGQYNLDWIVENNSPLAGIKTITLTVSWNSGGGRRRAAFTYMVADI